MIRAVKLSLKFCTAAKLAQVAQLLTEQVPLINRYVTHIWVHGGSLDKQTFDAVSCGRCSKRFASSALNQALSVIRATRASALETGVTPSRPTVRRGVVLDAKTFSIKAGRVSFDLVGKLATLRSGHPIHLPMRATKPLRKWLALPGATLKQGGILFPDHIICWVEIPDVELKDFAGGEVLGIDIGLNKLLATSDHQMVGTEMRAVVAKVRRAKPASKGKRRAQAARTHFINRCCKQLPWGTVSVLGMENLKNLKRGKRGRSKQFRKSIAPWTYRQAVARIKQLAQEHRVHLVRVDPAYTSRTCPHCGHCAKENRRGEHFSCLACGHTADADYVGACNVLVRTRATLGSVASPGAIKSRRRQKCLR